MLSSRLPTGTVTRDDSERRTYPRELRDRPPSDAGRPGRPPAASDRDTVAVLRNENEALRQQNARLRTQLDSEREGRQDVIDRYEYVVADVEQSAPTQRRRQHTSSGPVASLLGRLRELLTR